jgi:hypothetical protein
VIHNFAETIGEPDSAYVIPYPDWVDTRLVGYRAGYAGKDYALNVERIAETKANHNTKLFLVKPEDTIALDKLHRYYPQGFLKYYPSEIEGKAFWMFFVPTVDHEMIPEIP